MEAGRPGRARQRKFDAARQRSLAALDNLNLRFRRNIGQTGPHGGFYIPRAKDLRGVCALR